MNLQEIHANTVTLHVKDEKTGETFVRELPLEFYENANFLRLLGEDMNGKPSEIVFISDTGMRRLQDLTGHGPDEDPVALTVKTHNNFFFDESIIVHFDEMVNQTFGKSLFFFQNN